MTSRFLFKKILSGYTEKNKVQVIYLVSGGFRIIQNPLGVKNVSTHLYDFFKSRDCNKKESLNYYRETKVK
jgi:hypothetical protein